jgi:hypothetical protein
MDLFERQEMLVERLSACQEQWLSLVQAPTVRGAAVEQPSKPKETATQATTTALVALVACL